MPIKLVWLDANQIGQVKLIKLPTVTIIISLRFVSRELTANSIFILSHFTYLMSYKRPNSMQASNCFSNYDRMTK